MDKKKVTIAASIFGAVIAIGVALYFFVFRRAATAPPAGSTSAATSSGAASVGSIAASVAAANAGASSVRAGQATAPPGEYPSLTQLRAMNFKSSKNEPIDPTRGDSSLTSMDQNTGVVKQQNAQWSGTVTSTSPQVVIAWAKGNGETATWFQA